MNQELTCFLPAGDPADLTFNLEELARAGIDNICVLAVAGTVLPDLPGRVKVIEVFSLYASETCKKIALHNQSDYLLLYTTAKPLKPGFLAVERLIRMAEQTTSGMVYSGYYLKKGDQLIANPVIEYQDGSLRDDFDFGSLLLFSSAAFIEAVSRMKENFRYAGLYDLRLKCSQRNSILHLPELLYTVVERDSRRADEKMFDYVNPRNREVQIEMEHACTDHLRDVGGWLAPHFMNVHFSDHAFPYEASVIIPVRNRAKTIGDAITSVLSQKADFSFNLLIVDNHSTDGTNHIIRTYARKDKRVKLIEPERDDLGIGGCWNMALWDQACGKFAVQLDSDDLYIDDTVLARIVAAFYKQECAMLVGSYRMVNFRLQEIPPGIIDHREWTPDNGRNNALRVNGFGAPRAFFTPVVRSIGLPNVSYGEDYALGLNISRYYRIGRIYEPLYLCRRWEDNSDASLDVQKLNTYNFYKDKIRTIELRARQQYIQEGQEV
jgi:hypothetical protein